MIRNYFKIAWRNIKANKTYSAINIAGLSIGLASFLLIATVVINEYSYDRQWTKGDRIFRLIGENTATGERRISTPEPLGPQLSENFDQVESYSKITHRTVHFVLNKNPIELQSLQVNSGIWDFLDLKILLGNPQKFVNTHPNLVISEKIKKQYFSNIDPVGKIVKDISNFGESKEYLITGVIKDIPENTHLRADLLVISESKHTAFSSKNFVPYTTQYLLLKPEVSKASFLSGTNQWYNSLEASTPNTQFSLQPIKEIYLNSEDYYQKIKGNKRNTKILTGVAILLLLIACINFINLSTARTIKKIRNTSLRKVLGASKKSLIFQFLIESILFFGISYIFGLLVYFLFLPSLENFLASPLALSFTGNFQLFLYSLGVLVIISLLTGIYPAWLISSPKITNAVSNIFQTNKRSEFLRKGLVITQFSITVGVIIATLVINNQLQFLNQKDLGFNKNKLIKIDFTAWGDKGGAFKREIKKIPGVEAASIGQWIPSSAGGTFTSEVEDPQSPGNKIKTWYIDADKELFETLEMQLIKGRNLKNEFSAENILNFQTSEKEEKGAEMRPVLITAYTAERLQIDKLHKPFKDIKGIPVGVVRNFHNQSLRNSMEPTIIRAVKSPKYGNMLVRLNTENPVKSIKKMASVYNTFYPDNLFDYSWISDDLANEFRAENKLRTVLEIFSLLIVFLSCLGLFGLVTFMVQNRMKEISIRKVLGASVSQIVGIFSKDSLKLILLAVLISIPFAWYLLSQWLENFPYHIEMNAFIFIQGALSVILIALSTIAIKIISAAIKNPVKSLRTE